MEHTRWAMGEKDINKLFKIIKLLMPGRDKNLKDAMLNSFTYVLSM
jgi:hypothetical protein